MDYAKSENREYWYRHPTLGDPSFDLFEKFGETIHRSEAPYEWAVNGSLFRDPKTGYLYCYAGLYPYGYAANHDHPHKFIIYQSMDNGNTWRCTGDGFKAGFQFKNHDTASDSSPDVVITYDKDNDIYWLCYDWCDNNFTWGQAHTYQIPGNPDSGAALAWSKSPEGPFTRLDTPFFSNKQQYGKIGRFTRGYASTLLKRKNDWIVYVLCDSASHFAWGLVCMTAKTPYGPWSEPVILLSCDRPEYYPAPVEFYPCFEYEGIVYAPATSVSKNRNYQAVFTAKLEESHLPSAWRLEYDGDFWHSRNLPDEKYGIWGQTIHGFVKDNVFTVIYPSKDEREFGTISLAKRKFDTPFSDGFVFSGHAGKSVSPLLCSYQDFTLDAELDFTGEIEIAFDYSGILGPNMHCSDAEPHRQSLTSYYSVVLNQDGRYKLIKKDKDSHETVLFDGKNQGRIKNIRIANNSSQCQVFINNSKAGEAEVRITEPNPVAIIAHEFTVLSCTKFEIEGRQYPYRLRYNSLEAILNAGRLINEFQRDESLHFMNDECYTTEGETNVKWNFIGDGFCIFSPKSPDLGAMEIWLDGTFITAVSLYSVMKVSSQIVFTSHSLEFGRHCVQIKPHTGRIAVDVFECRGEKYTAVIR